MLQSREINSALVLMFVFITLRLYGGTMYEELVTFSRKALSVYPSSTEDIYDFNGLAVLFLDTVLSVVRCVGPILAVALLTGLFVNYAQVGFLFTMETLTPKFDRINPFNGFKRMFSTRSTVELIKALLKITVIIYVTYSYLNKETVNVIKLMDVDPGRIAVYVTGTAINGALRICAVLLILAVMDYGFQWFQYEKDLRMSKQEVKEEYKQVEGNPEIWSKIKLKQREMSMRRMLHEVPKADVVITNPTHFAVALKYDTAVSSAPVVIAKGQDFIAMRIKEVAKENRIEMVENKALARNLYENVEIGQAIPPDLYQAVAEVLAFVYNLKKTS